MGNKLYSARTFKQKLEMRNHKGTQFKETGVLSSLLVFCLTQNLTWTEKIKK